MESDLRNVIMQEGTKTYRLVNINLSCEGEIESKHRKWGPV